MAKRRRKKSKAIRTTTASIQQAVERAKQAIAEDDFGQLKRDVQALKEAIGRQQVAQEPEMSQVHQTFLKIDPEETAQRARDKWLHRDTRVIEREKEILAFRLEKAEEHHQALLAALGEIQLHKARLQAQLDGIARVLDRRDP